jgi:hypothetical protein
MVGSMVSVFVLRFYDGCVLTGSGHECSLSRGDVKGTLLHKNHCPKNHCKLSNSSLLALFQKMQMFCLEIAREGFLDHRTTIFVVAFSPPK